MPMACLPVEIAGRNRMMRYMAMQAIRLDPAWKNGEYGKEAGSEPGSEPTNGLRTASELLLIMGSSPLQMQKNSPTRAQAEAYVDRYLAASLARTPAGAPRTDANDMLYFLNASRLYDPSKKLSTITAPVLWINSADDFINPPELGIAEKMAPLMPHARFILLPITDATRGHGTHTQAAVWKDYMIDFLHQTEPQIEPQAAPRIQRQTEPR